MQYLMLIHRYQVSNNYWKVDYGKQKRTVTIFERSLSSFARARQRSAISTF